MRYLPSITGGSSRFNDGRRPALNKVPKDLAALVRERDRLLAQRFEAKDRVHQLAAPEVRKAAELADDEAATTAARAGQKIPAATAVAKLEADQAEAARALEAQDAALAAVTGDCDTLAAKHYWDTAETRAAERAKMRADVAAKAAELADAVEAAVDSFSVSDWLRTGVYNTSALTWPTDVVDLSRYGLDHFTTSTIHVRDVLIAAATTVLEDPTD